MRTALTSRGAAMIAGLLCCGAAMPAHAELYDFQVRCNGNPVGHHTVVVTRHDDQTDVHVDIALAVHVAGLELYRYRHVSQELWRDGKLVSLESSTDDDGEPLTLSVHRDGDGHLVAQNAEGKHVLPDDVVPTSYWNPALLTRSEVLDSQSGKLMKVAITQQPDGSYKMSGDLRIQLNYQQGRWSGLHFSYIGADVDYEKREQLSETKP
jgi:hypothetical protein